MSSDNTHDNEYSQEILGEIVLEQHVTNLSHQQTYSELDTEPGGAFVNLAQVSKEAETPQNHPSTLQGHSELEMVVARAILDLAKSGKFARNQQNLMSPHQSHSELEIVAFLCL